MKKALTVLLIIFPTVLLANEISSGLHFKSYTTLGRDRTSLVLNDDKPLDLKQEITLSFDILIRQEVVFGRALTIVSNTNEHITLSFSADEKDNRYPTFLINESLNPVSDKIEYNNWFEVSIKLLPEKDSVILVYNNIKKNYPLRFDGWKNIKISFGVCPFEGYTFAEIPPINLKNVKIYNKNKLIRYWALDKHSDDICYDLVNYVPAIAKNAVWIIDRHTEWKKIYNKDFKGVDEKQNKVIISPQYAYNSMDDILYIVPDNNTVICFDPVTKKDSVIYVNSGYPAGSSTNQMKYDPVNNQLISYNLDSKTISRFSFETASWTGNSPNTLETNYWHHTSSYYEKGNSIFAFGGYGFYQYKNDLFRINLSSGEWDINKIVSIAPRYSSASVIVDDKLYIFGGRGSETGKQELNPHVYIDLHCVDLNTKETNLLWQTHAEKPLMPCGNMVYYPKDSCFYALVSQNNGSLYRISMQKPEVTEVANSLHESLESDFPFYTLYYSENQDKLYALLCRTFKEGNSEISFHEINFPPVPVSDTIQTLPMSKKASTILISILICTLALVGCILLFLFKNRKRKMRLGQSLMVTDDTVKIHRNNEDVHFFDRSAKSISLLGGFNVMDKKGVNITPNFTPILKSLLLLILLNSENEEKGINSKKIDSLLWFDKEEKAARNNRNVSLNRLKSLLENIGDIQLINNGGFWKISFGEGVFCDYYKAHEFIREVKGGHKLDNNFIPKLLELLMFGPLLPYTHSDWLDKFKSNYSNDAIDILNSLLLRKEYEKDTDLRLQITDTIFLYDSLNEEALSIKCLILYNSGKKGLAKTAYDNFCKEYMSMLGEEYKYSLSQIIDFSKNGWPE